jgi:hypothetical protein
MASPVTRSPNQGTLCGYVGVPLDQHDAPDLLDGLEAIAHGGLTYQGLCQGHICHVPEPGEGEVFWFGFDCGHYKDFQPGTRGTCSRGSSASG